MDEILARELVLATNQMYESLTSYQVDRGLENGEPARHLIQCATTGCSLLSNDAYMQALVDDARMLQHQRWRRRRDMQVITGRHFEVFLGVESRLLQQAGIDRGLIDIIIGRCREAREPVRRGNFDPNAFTAALGDLRLEVCGVLAELLRATLAQRPPDQPSQRLAAVLKGVCGCVVVGLDASALASTVGLTAAGSAVSIAVGTAMVGQAITDFSGTRRHRRIRLPRRFRHH